MLSLRKKIPFSTEVRKLSFLEYIARGVDFTFRGKWNYIDESRRRRDQLLPCNKAILVHPRGRFASSSWIIVRVHADHLKGIVLNVSGAGALISGSSDIVGASVRTERESYRWPRSRKSWRIIVATVWNSNRIFRTARLWRELFRPKVSLWKETPGKSMRRTLRGWNSTRRTSNTWDTWGTSLAKGEIIERSSDVAR